MKCNACGLEEMGAGITTFTFYMNNYTTTVQFINVPAEVCWACGHSIIADEVLTTMRHVARRLSNNSIRVAIFDYVDIIGSGRSCGSAGMVYAGGIGNLT